MTRLALFGAGGKMGMRLGRNLKSSAYEVAAVELSSEGQRRIESELGWKGVWTEGPFYRPENNVIMYVLLMSLPGVAGVARFMRASASVTQSTMTAVMSERSSHDATDVLRSE